MEQYCLSLSSQTLQCLWFKDDGIRQQTPSLPPPKSSIGALHDAHHEPERAEMIVVKVKDCGVISQTLQKCSKKTSDCFGDDHLLWFVLWPIFLYMVLFSLQ